MSKDTRAYNTVVAGRSRSVDDLVAKARRSSAGIILMGYEGLRRHADTLLALDWGYVILDEGHRIRNPDAEITLLCKQVCFFQLQLHLRSDVPTGNRRWRRIGSQCLSFNCTLSGEIVREDAGKDVPQADHVRHADTEPPERVVVSFRLCVSRQAWHPSCVSGSSP